MTTTVAQMLAAIGAYTDIDTAAPSGDDETTRVSYLDQAQKEWALAYDWKSLRKTSYPSFTASGVSIGLDSLFIKQKSPLVDFSNGVPVQSNYVFEALDDPKDRFSKLSTDKYTYIMGDDISGKYFVTSPIASGASLGYDWQSFPSSLVTLQDSAMCPHPEFLVKRGIAYVLESRSDPRFPQVKADADRLLANMIAEQDADFGARPNKVRNTYEKSGYIIGE